MVYISIGGHGDQAIGPIKTGNKTMSALPPNILAGEDLVRDAESRNDAKCQELGKPNGDKLESERNFNYRDVANMTEEEAHMYANG